MLVLGRKKNQSLILTMPDGRRITVTVAQVRSGSCRLGITAPDDVAVMRDEIQREIDAGKEVTS